MATKITVTVPSGKPLSYDVHIGRGASDSLGEILSAVVASKRATVITSENIWPLVGETIDGSLEISDFTFDLIEIPDGEAYKTIETWHEVLVALSEFGAGRGDAIIAVGGGVVGDLAGFAAAAYMRGAPFVNVPTTLLAQVDSSIGGKTGVDLPAGKNLVGAFYQPMAVVSDTAFLATLPEREIRCGLAEIIKSAMLAGGDFLSFINDGMDNIVSGEEDALSEAVVKTAGFKAGIVGEDEKDVSGRRAILNYGHTFGHALEAASEYRELNHGEAVAIGLRFAANLGERLGVSGRHIAEATDMLLGKAGFEIPDGLADTDEAKLIEAIRLDKKKTGSAISFILLEDFGRPVIREVDEITIMETIKEMRR